MKDPKKALEDIAKTIGVDGVKNLAASVPAEPVVMRLPPEIPKGNTYWKKRQRELLIMQVMGRATTPQTGWHVFQKVKRFNGMSGDESCSLMLGLAERGYLRIAGNDNDCGYMYSLPDA